MPLVVSQIFAPQVVARMLMQGRTPRVPAGALLYGVEVAVTGAVLARPVVVKSGHCVLRLLSLSPVFLLFPGEQGCAELSVAGEYPFIDLRGLFR